MDDNNHRPMVSLVIENQRRDRDEALNSHSKAYMVMMIMMMMKLLIVFTDEWTSSKSRIWGIQMRTTTTILMMKGSFCCAPTSPEAPYKVADCTAMSFVFVCWHGRTWWPPIRGRTKLSWAINLEVDNLNSFPMCIDLSLEPAPVCISGGCKLHIGREF